MKPEVASVGVAIVRGACNPEAKDLAVDISQFGLVELLGETVLKEVPVMKGVIACFKVPLAIRDQLFLRKVAGFLSSIPNFTDAQKEAFTAEHLADSKKASKLGESVVLLLDRLDDMEKPQMVAKIFAAFVRGKITFAIFRRLASAIDLGAIDDLREFAKPMSNPKPSGIRIGMDVQMLRTNLARTGLVSLPSYFSGAPITGVTFKENELGKVFREIMDEAAANTDIP